MSKDSKENSSLKAWLEFINNPEEKPKKRNRNCKKSKKAKISYRINNKSNRTNKRRNREIIKLFKS